MKAWLKGGLIGLIISAIIISFTWLCLFTARGESGMGCLSFPAPFFYVLSFMGLDYITYLISKDYFFNYFFLSQVFGPIIFIFLGGFVGFCLDRNYSAKKKIIFFLILLLIFVPSSSYIHFLKFRDNKLIEENRIYSGSEDGLKWKTPETINSCNKISIFNPSYENECLIAAAATSKNTDVCNNIIKIDGESSEFWYNRNKERCIVMVANVTKDISLCKNLKYLEVECISYIALETNNLELCPPGVYWCIENIAILRQDSSLCDTLIEGNKQSCYSNLALKTNNEKLCEKLSAGDFCFQQVANYKKDENICMLINDTSYKEYCISQIGIEKKDINVCRKSGNIGSENHKDFCILIVAKETKNPSFCQEIINEGYKNECIKNS